MTHPPDTNYDDSPAEKQILRAVGCLCLMAIGAVVGVVFVFATLVKIWWPVAGG
jgi:hypothetical protein